jgi:hypothetical protein
VLLALLPEQAVPQVFDFGILDNQLLLQLRYLGFGSPMLGFPIAGPLAQLNMCLFGNRHPVLSKAGAGFSNDTKPRVRPLSCKVGVCGTFHGPVYTLFFFLCPVLFFGNHGVAEYLQRPLPRDGGVDIFADA